MLAGEDDGRRVSERRGVANGAVVIECVVIQNLVLLIFSFVVDLDTIWFETRQALFFLFVSTTWVSAILLFGACRFPEFLALTFPTLGTFV